MTASLVDAQESSVDATKMSVLSKIGGNFVLKEEQRTVPMAFLCHFTPDSCQQQFS